MPVVSLRTVTVAPGTREPIWSVTRPLMTPRSARCATSEMPRQRMAGTTAGPTTRKAFTALLLICIFQRCQQTLYELLLTEDSPCCPESLIIEIRERDPPMSARAGFVTSYPTHQLAPTQEGLPCLRCS